MSQLAKIDLTDARLSWKAKQQIKFSLGLVVGVALGLILAWYLIYALQTTSAYNDSYCGYMGYESDCETEQK